jgi:hypothetical protein
LTYQEARGFYTQSRNIIGDIDCFDPRNAGYLLCTISTSASPLGSAYVTLLPPLSEPSSYRYNRTQSTATRRDRSDPPRKVLILAEVSWEPLDETGFIPIWICILPLAWVTTLIGLTFWIVKQRSNIMRTALNDAVQP